MITFSIERLHAIAQSIGCEIIDETHTNRGPNYRLSDKNRETWWREIHFTCQDLDQMAAYLQGLQKGMEIAAKIAERSIGDTEENLRREFTRI